MFKEFKQFALKGSVIDLAVGVVIVAAFGKITSSLVSDIIMPPIGVIISEVYFSDLALILKQAINSLRQKNRRICHPGLGLFRPQKN